MTHPPDTQPAADDDNDSLDDLAENTVAEDAADSFSDEDVDVSAEFQGEVKKMEDVVWHAPQGPGTRIVAVIILVGIALALIAMVFLAIASLTKS